MSCWASVYTFSKKMIPGFERVYANELWRNPDYKQQVSRMLGCESKDIKYVSRFAKGGNTFFNNKDVSPNALERRYVEFSQDPIFKRLVAKHYDVFFEFLSFYQEQDMIYDLKNM